jgi:hypothetical protein
MNRTQKNQVHRMLTDEAVPLAARRAMLKQVVAAEDEALLDLVLRSASAGSAEDRYAEQRKELAALLTQLQEGPLRSATFLRMGDAGGLGRRALVVLPDGTHAYCVVPEAAMAEAMRCGDSVWLEAQGRAVLFHQREIGRAGEVARIERRLPGGELEVSLGEVGRFVCSSSALLDEQLERGEAGPGSSVLACPRRLLAFRALPPENGAGNLRYLSRRPVPDVVIERDIGAPPAYLAAFGDHLRRELARPELGARYRIRRSLFQLLVGVAGTGKTLSVLGFWNLMYALMSEHTGVPVEALPQRVVQLDAASVLSKWLGSSDRNLARFFGEIRQLAAQTFEGPDGRVHELPVLVICEEIDALARERGEDGIHDRIMAGLLAGLDPEQSVFREHLVFVVCTTNVPHLVDAAALRRMGGSVEHFRRLGRRSFRAVLSRQLARRPLANGANGAGGDDASARARAVADVATWLYAPGNDAGQVALTYVGEARSDVRHRRDFLTPALVDRAVQQACREACHAEWTGAGPGGLTTVALMKALDRQVRDVVEQLDPRNCHHHLSLPEGTRVASVRRLESPAVLPLELERAS